MKYRQRKELVRGESPWVEVTLDPTGSYAKEVVVHYARESVAKDVKTTTFGKLIFTDLDLDDLACVARTASRALREAQHAHLTHTNDLMNGVSRQLGA